jgi:hypothetical protein
MIDRLQKYSPFQHTFSAVLPDFATMLRPVAKKQSLFVAATIHFPHSMTNSRPEHPCIEAVSSSADKR